MIETSYNTYRPCECQEKERYQRILQRSGITDEFQKISFDNYEIWNPDTKAALGMAKKYVEQFIETEKGRNNSIAYLGQIGAGKTHLAIAIANALMAINIGVVYMPYKEVISYLKQIKREEESYQKEMNKYKNARVLLIDDLYKGKNTDSDLDIMFELINHRYLAHLPIIVSSEMLTDSLKEGEFAATGSRLIQMCKGRLYQFRSAKGNYRLRID